MSDPPLARAVDGLKLGRIWTTGIAILLMPQIVPLVRLLGVDPVQFGIFMMPDLGIGLITPPAGILLFVGSAARKLKIGVVTKAMGH